MPELRLVVLATQDRLAYGANFEEALTNLFGASASAPAPEKQEPPTGKPGESAPPPAASPSPTESTQQLINKAIQEFEEYQRLTAEGKLGEAGRKLEEHKRTLEQLKRASSH